LVLICEHVDAQVGHWNAAGREYVMRTIAMTGTDVAERGRKTQREGGTERKTDSEGNRLSKRDAETYGERGRDYDIDKESRRQR
jgi:hypothetical protein